MGGTLSLDYQCIHSMIVGEGQKIIKICARNFSLKLCVSVKVPVRSGTRRILRSAFWTKETRGDQLGYSDPWRCSGLRM